MPKKTIESLTYRRNHSEKVFKLYKRVENELYQQKCGTKREFWLVQKRLYPQKVE